VLGTFPKAFYHGDFSSDNFPSGNFPKFMLGLLRRAGCNGARALRLAGLGPSATAGKVTAWEIAHLGISHLGKYPWEVATWGKSFGKVPYIIGLFSIN